MKTILFILLAALSVQGASITQTPTSPDRSIRIPSGAGAVTNIGFQSNMRYVLDLGTNSIFATRAVDSNMATNAPLQIVAKTNIVIEGLGWGSVIFSPTLGNFFYISHSSGITFKNLALIGTRALYDNVTNGLFGAASITGTNNFITFENCYFKNHSDHGVVTFAYESLGQPPRVLNGFRFANCLFEDIGTTNGSPDGTAISIGASNTVITGCTFVRCRLANEFEGDSTRPVNFVEISGNTYRGGLMQQIIQYGSAGGVMKYSDITIRDNRFYYDQTTVWGGTAVAIQLDGAKRVKIINNYFNNTDSAIVASAVNDDMDGLLISGNTIVTNAIFQARGCIEVGASGGKIFDNATISQCFFTNANWWGIELFGATRCTVDGCVFDRVGSGGSFGFPISVIPGNGGSTTTSNIIRGCKFLRTTGGATVAGIEVQSGVSFTKIFENDFGISIPWSDAGTATMIWDNWLGTNFMPHTVFTNNFVNPGGSNVIWNVAGPNKVQFIDVTNTCLLQITNYSTFNTAYRSKLILINNRSTNCGVFASLAGVRLLGQDATLLSAATAGAHNSLTNGRSMVLDAEYVGTNLIVTVNHQR